MLHPVSELSQDDFGNVQGTLSDKVNAYALGPNQPNHLLDFLGKHRGQVIEQQMGLVEEEHQLRLLGIANLRQLLVEFRQ
ncbi:MAG TPA: hypothetical protein VK466_13005 [Terriglobales bacterium]|nr:hypothetical protein [Terriglobales bacterium]